MLPLSSTLITLPATSSSTAPGVRMVTARPWPPRRICDRLLDGHVLVGAGVVAHADDGVLDRRRAIRNAGAELLLHRDETIYENVADFVRRRPNLTR
jgi:hypothetical protein